ncbi:unnamed protein product [Absidia cylindrospora]
MFEKKKPQQINTHEQVNDVQNRTCGRTAAQPRRQSLDAGISPTYYQDGDIVTTTAQRSSYGSPVHDDASRIFFSHHRTCVCKGSGVGCECTRDCSC